MDFFERAGRLPDPPSNLSTKERTRTRSVVAPDRHRKVHEPASREHPAAAKVDSKWVTDCFSVLEATSFKVLLQDRFFRTTGSGSCASSFRRTTTVRVSRESGDRAAEGWLGQAARRSTQLAKDCARIRSWQKKKSTGGQEIEKEKGGRHQRKRKIHLIQFYHVLASHLVVSG